MKFDFTSIMDRHGRDAEAIDALGQPGAPGLPKPGFDAIPMWVADMNFPTAPGVCRCITERVQHPAFGYFEPRREYFDAIINWQKRRNGAEISDECIGYENGVLGGVVSALNAVCPRGGDVLVHSPTYVGFTGLLRRNGWNAVHSPLFKDEGGIYRMDFADMEKKLSSRRIHAAIFCSPHNPCGRVWEAWEIEKAMALFEKYQVMVVSDEIWSDLILGGHKHIPTQNVSAYARTHTAAMYAPSKTFNLAGLIGSYHIIYDGALRDRVRAESSLCGYNHMNMLSMYGLIGAYSEEGMEWLDELRGVLTGNVRFAVGYIREHFAGVDCPMPEGTYMLFPDCSGWLREHGKTLDELERAAWDVGVALQDGRGFFGESHVRINLALPRSRVEEAFSRLDRFVFNA